MFYFLLILHSLFRWLLLSALLLCIAIAYRGWNRRLEFTLFANKIRHWTATIAHFQLMIGITIYVQSATVKSIVLDNDLKIVNEQIFFKYIHIGLMLISIVLITIGSAKAKRMTADTERYHTMLIWFTLALIIIFIAVPWPFSPLASRPYVRPF